MDFSKRLNKWLCLTVCITMLLGVSLCCFVSGESSQDVAEATAISPGTGLYINDDLLLDDYTTRHDGKVFNNNVLREIYEKVTGYTDIANVTSVANTSKSGAKNIHSGLNSAEIRDKNENKQIGFHRIQTKRIARFPLAEKIWKGFLGC